MTCTRRVLLLLSLLSVGCASLPPPPGRGMDLRYTPRNATVPASAVVPDTGSPRRITRDAVTARAPDDTQTDARRSALAAWLAFRGAILDVSGSTHRISAELSSLKARERGLFGGEGVFAPFIDSGAEPLRWMDAQLAAATRLAQAASQVEDPDMQLALLRLAGPRLEAAMMGSILLAVWLDFLHLADVALAQRVYPAERLVVDMVRWRKMFEPVMRALASGEPAQEEAAARELPALVGHLTNEFAAARERMRVAAENLQKVQALTQAIETVTMLSALKFSLPSVPPSAPALLGVGLVAGGDGVMMGTRIVVSAEWVEMMRHLVRAGILSLPVVSAAVRIQAGQVLMAQAHDELPRGVREALGDGPEVRAMRQTGRAGAGMAEPPQHHVLPQEFREWFEQRGFTGEMDIDQFCVEMEQAHHEAIHGGGDWKLGRQWPGEWNRMIMEALQKAETRAGRMLTTSEILTNVGPLMKRYNLPLDFVAWRGP